MAAARVAGASTRAQQERSSHRIVDARRCLAWLVQSPGVFPKDARVALGNRLYGCDECQEVCPPNIVADRRADDDDHEVPAPGVDVLDLLAASDETLLERHGRWSSRSTSPLPHRNALIILGNTGDGRGGSRRRCAPTSRIRRPAAHAAWACIQLTMRSLLALVADDRPARACRA
jgi:epoxyqueuosine reductase